MKVTTDSCLFGAWVAREIDNGELIINNSLDIGAGTGLLSLMLVQKTNIKIDAIEIDQESYKQAKDNIEASPWHKNITIFQDDVRNFEFQQQYDVIISNPPFYENELRSNDPKKNIALHSYELTLEELLKVIQTNLTTNGIFFLLLPYKRQEEIMRIFKKFRFSLLKIIFVRQSVKHYYFRMMIKGAWETDEMMETTFDEISIRNSQQEYTPEFIELLKDYYLHF